MRASLMWTINDFPAYGMLSGWGTHGKMGCPHCMGNKKGGKNSWFVCHRRFLPRNHSYRRNMTKFKKYVRVKHLPPPRLPPWVIWEQVSELPKCTDTGKACQI